jgi:glucose-6-phosphate 1-dehydrogenase
MKTQLVIFGLAGDLGQRKLLPALDDLLNQKHLKPTDLEVIGISRREVDASDILAHSLGDEAESSKLSSILKFHQMNLADLDDYISLKKYLSQDKKTQILLYLSVPPTSAAKISELAGKAGLNSPNVKILFEKPFGINLTSAESFLEATHEYFPESQILRVDHYLAKKSVRNLTSIFEKNDILRQTLALRQITSIEIIASEKIDIEGRGIFYEQTGVLRDFIQGHLMEILAVILSKGSNDLRNARAEALENILSVVDTAVQARRAQYIGYRTEAQSPKSIVETFADIQLFSNDENWKNIPIHLISGKALNSKKSQIIIHFVKNKPGLRIDLAEQPSDIQPYAQAFLDAINGNSDYFVSQREILASWRIFDEILKDWAFSGEEGLITYQKGIDWQNI